MMDVHEFAFDEFRPFIDRYYLIYEGMWSWNRFVKWFDETYPDYYLTVVEVPGPNKDHRFRVRCESIVTFKLLYLCS